MDQEPSHCQLAKCWWCAYTIGDPDAGTSLQVLRAEVRRETVFADERYSQVILDILAGTDMGRLAPMPPEKDTQSRARHRGGNSGS
jgi:hypothetical protein